MLVSHSTSAALLVPLDLSPGDQYHLVFNSLDFTNALSSDISYYNNFVQTAADTAGIGSSEGVAWTAIASTDLIDARDNAVVGTNTPVYNMRQGQLEKVADGFNDLWDGGLDSLLAYDEYGQANSVDAWTGSLSSGLRASGSTLGNISGTAWCGRPTLIDSRWLTFFEPATSALLHVYALSEAITVTDGDFNQDNYVDGADFLQWQQGESPNPLSAMDLAAWEANFGTVMPLSVTTSTVPEPATGFMLMLGMMVLHCCRAEGTT